MRKRLRLLVTEKCPRNCEGCCNQYWDLKSLPVFSLNDVCQYKELIITGGEPMLIPKLCGYLAHRSHYINPDILIYLYTAKTKPLENLIYIMPFIDGLCITLHDQSDIKPFLAFQDWLIESNAYIEKSMRLNIFNEEIKIATDYFEIWKLKNKKWIPHQHLNEHEVFMRL